MGKDPLTFEILTFHKGESVRDDDRSIFVAMNST